MDCLFCKIIKGEIPSFTIYEDEQVKVFLDINPKTNGHALIVPKKHIVTINDVDDELAKHIVKVEKIFYQKLKEKLHIEGLTICQNNELGQDVKHFHVHITPRYQDDHWEMQFNQESLKAPEEIFKQITSE